MSPLLRQITSIVCPFQGSQHQHQIPAVGKQLQCLCQRRTWLRALPQLMIIRRIKKTTPPQAVPPPRRMLPLTSPTLSTTLTASICVATSHAGRGSGGR